MLEVHVARKGMGNRALRIRGAAYRRHCCQQMWHLPLHFNRANCTTDSGWHALHHPRHAPAMTKRATMSAIRASAPCCWRCRAHNSEHPPHDSINVACNVVRCTDKGMSVSLTQHCKQSHTTLWRAAFDRLQQCAPTRHQTPADDMLYLCCSAPGPADSPLCVSTVRPVCTARGPQGSVPVAALTMIIMILAKMQAAGCYPAANTHPSTTPCMSMCSSTQRMHAEP
jgi:hypothetical protein